MSLFEYIILLTKTYKDIKNKNREEKKTEKKSICEQIKKKK